MIKFIITDLDTKETVFEFEAEFMGSVTSTYAEACYNGVVPLENLRVFNVRYVDPKSQETIYLMSGMGLQHAKEAAEAGDNVVAFRSAVSTFARRYRWYNTHNIHQAVQKLLADRPEVITDPVQLAFEMPRISDDGTRLSYIRSADKGERDLWTVTSVQKYLRRHTSMPDHELRDFCACCDKSNMKYEIIFDTNEIVDLMVHGDVPGSCMTGKWHNSDYHPYNAYASEYGWGMAVRVAPDGRIDARAIVNRESMQFVRSYTNDGQAYADRDVAIERWLEDQGYEHVSEWKNGLKLKRIPYGGDSLLVPYLDGDVNHFDDCGEYLRISDSGEFEADRPDGIVSIYTTVCEDCGDPVDEDDTTRTYHGDYVCSHCLEHHYVFCETYDEYVHTDSREYDYLVCIDGDYFANDDDRICYNVDEEEYMFVDDCYYWESDGEWHSEPEPEDDDDEDEDEDEEYNPPVISPEDSLTQYDTEQLLSMLRQAEGELLQGREPEHEVFRRACGGDPEYAPVVIRREVARVLWRNIAQGDKSVMVQSDPAYAYTAMQVRTFISAGVDESVPGVSVVSDWFWQWMVTDPYFAEFHPDMAPVILFCLGHVPEGGWTDVEVCRAFAACYHIEGNVLRNWGKTPNQIYTAWSLDAMLGHDTAIPWDREEIGNNNLKHLRSLVNPPRKPVLTGMRWIVENHVKRGAPAREYIVPLFQLIGDGSDLPYQFGLLLAGARLADSEVSDLAQWSESLVAATA